MDIETTFKNDRNTPLVHINTVFPDSLCAAILAKLRGQKIVYYGHSTMEDFRDSFRMSNILAPLFKRWLKVCYSMGDVIITPTEYSKRILESYGIKKTIHAISNGIDTDFFSFSAERRRSFREEHRLEYHDKAVMSVGHYIGRKGIMDYIELARTMPQVHFFWFGHTNLNLIPHKIREAIKTAPVNLHFPGYIGQEALRDAYCGCDLFCFMSNEETEGIVVLEALSCSIPVLVRDIPVYEGWLMDGENAYKGRDFQSFVRGTAAILDHRAADLTKNGRATAETRSIRETGKQLVSIYQTVLGTSRHKYRYDASMSDAP